MSFSTFEITELSENHDDDYQVEIVSSGNLHGMQFKEAELQMLGESFIDVIEQDADYVDERDVGDYVEGDD